MGGVPVQPLPRGVLDVATCSWPRFSHLYNGTESKTISRKGLAALYGLVATSAAWGSTVHLPVPRFTHFISERVEFWPLMCFVSQGGRRGTWGMRRPN